MRGQSETIFAVHDDSFVDVRWPFSDSPREFTSASEFECGAGSMVAGVTLVGDVVKLAE